MFKHLLNLFRDPVARVIGFIFFTNGFIFGSWASCIPHVKDKFHLNEGTLGLLLLSMPIGVLCMNPWTVSALRKYGINRPMIISGVSLGFAFAIPVVSPNLVLVSIGLIIAGCVFACENVAMNTYASNLEEHHGKRLMSACHGMWSLGAMSGALLTSLSSGFFRNYFDRLDSHSIYFLFVSCIIAACIFILTKRIKKIPDPIYQSATKDQNSGSILKPKGTLLTLAAILICTYFTEGTMADWSAVYMADIVLSPATMIGWGYAMYAACMAAGRFMGDELIFRYTNMVVLRIGGFLVIAGMLWIVGANNAWMVLPGFMLVGLGISLASPILYGASARVHGLAPGVGLATMNSFGLAAFLTGPVLVGFIAKLVDLRFAFLLVILTAVIWIFLTSALIRKKMVL